MSKLDNCTNRNGKSPSPHRARQSVIIAGNVLSYSGARPALLSVSPWYQITPLIVKSFAGATIPLNKPAGAHESGFGCHGCFGADCPAACAFASSRFSASRIAATSLWFSTISTRCANCGINPASLLNPSRLIHAATGVPPHVESISPIGTCSCFTRSRAKKYATAEKSVAVSGVHNVQLALWSRSS